jgi:uncharacterized protein (TIGR02466 family)
LANYNVLPLFATPVFVSNLDIDLTKLLPYFHNIDYERMPNNSGCWSKNKFILNEPECAEIKSKIEEQINVYTKELLCVKDTLEFYLMNSWGLRLNPNDFAAAHQHGNSLFSGVVYLDANPDSGSIIFEKQLNHLNLFSPCVDPDITEWNIFNSKEWTVDPNQKMIILFPSHLKHRVNPNTTLLPRYSLSFNVYIKGTINDVPNSITTLTL